MSILKFYLINRKTALEKDDIKNTRHCPNLEGSDFDRCSDGGPEGVRTLDLCVANAALSQLSYKPEYKQKSFQIQNTLPIGSVNCGADYEARTRYLHLGKVALYQMS